MCLFDAVIIAYALCVSILQLDILEIKIILWSWWITHNFICGGDNTGCILRLTERDHGLLKPLNYHRSAAIEASGLDFSCVSQWIVFAIKFLCVSNGSIDMLIQAPDTFKTRLMVKYHLRLSKSSCLWRSTLLKPWGRKVVNGWEPYRSKLCWHCFLYANIHRSWVDRLTYLINSIATCQKYFLRIIALRLNFFHRKKFFRLSWHGSMVWIFSKILKNLFNLILLKSLESNFFFILKFGGLRLKNIIDVPSLRFEIW